jgi:hypothetical protein
MLARCRFGQYEECDMLLSNWHQEDILIFIHSFYEWIDPITDHPDGSFPYRTGISSVRLAIADIIKKNQKKVTSSSFSKESSKRVIKMSILLPAWLNHGEYLGILDNQSLAAEISS